MNRSVVALALCLQAIPIAVLARAQDPSVASLPAGVRAVWDAGKAYREATPTRERMSINGLWRWQPAGGVDTVPERDWGWFKVPGCWPGLSDWLQKDSQTVYAHPAWKGTRLGEVTAAWYQREVTLPAGWAGRRIALAADYVNSFATVFVDGRKAGEIRFPGGEADLTGALKPGAKHVLSLAVIAMPMKGVRLSFSDTNSAKQVRGSVERRGLCGDLWLVSTPAGPRLGDVRVDTSTRKWEATFQAELTGLPAGRTYSLRARISDHGKPVAAFESGPFGASDLKDGRFAFTAKWHPAKLWDIHTPGNQFDVALSLVSSAGKVLDAGLPVRFGFREFWIAGRDFQLNGTRIWLSALPLDNAQVGAASSTYEAAKESFLRLKSFGINFVYGHNYGCEPGTHLSFEDILRAADDVGMLVALSQPHFSSYDWQAPDADRANGYARDAAFYVRVAGSHPSVVFYSMSHNACGYSDDMNPDMIDGVHDNRSQWAVNNVKCALRAEAIVKALDPARIVYHHSSGNLGSMHSSNFYTNFAPIQELDDWLEHWATEGKKPFFTCEYMVPCTWDWTMYRGWYKGGREFGSAAVPWDFSLAEWSAQFLGDAAYSISQAEAENIRWEARQVKEGNLWHRWDYPHQVGDRVFDEQHRIIGQYLTSNWRAFRTWGLSANSPWEANFYWRLRPGVQRKRVDLTVDWDALQRPGYSPDYVDERYERMDLAYERTDWEATEDGKAILRNNMPLLAYIAGKPSAFTSKDHLFAPGETIQKQIVVINNSRETVTAECSWSLALPTPISGSKAVTVPTGDQARVPLRFDLPTSLAPGRYRIAATVRFSTDETQTDEFQIDVLPKPAAPKVSVKVALFDPKGETTKLLAGMGVQFQTVDANADLAGLDVLIVGKGALTPDGLAPSIARVRDGLTVVVFEQSAEVLEKRFGFRVQEYGLRQVFPRVPDHPLLQDLSAESLRDWRGEATLTPARLKYELSPALAYTPAIRWCGLEVSHVWRCGNRGNVASVLIEKPARGDFLPIVDGGYSLQYSPLMEYRDGAGMVLFCQMDVTGRTEADPAAPVLVSNILRYLSTWTPGAVRKALYAGDADGFRHLQAAGVAPERYEGGVLPADSVLVLGSGAGQALAGNGGAVAEFVRGGGRLLSLGLDAAELNLFLAEPIETRPGEHLAARFGPPANGSPLAGVSSADVHNRDPRVLPLVTGGAKAAGDGVLAAGSGGNTVFCQMVPWEVSRAQGRLPSFAVAAGEAAEGKQCAHLTMGSPNGAGVQFGQKVAGGEAGKTYTFVVFAKALDGPVAAHLEIERPARPWDRALKAPNVTIPEGQWTEVHATFRVEKSFGEGWFAYVACAQEGARLKLDSWRLYEGEYVAGGMPAGATNLFANAGFEAGTELWRFSFHEAYNVRKTYRRSSFLLTRLLANLGVQGQTPLLERFAKPAAAAEKRWLDGFYLDEPEEWDDPYRFFRW